MTLPLGLLGALPKKKPAPTPTPVQSPSGPMIPLNDARPMPSQYGAIGASQFGPDQNLIGTQFTPPTGPDRGELAAKTFSALTAETDPQYQQDLRSVGQRAAQYGRIGSGVTTSELGDVALQRQKFLGAKAAELASESAGQTLADRQLQFQDLTGERGYQAGLSQQAFNNALAAAGLTGPSSAALNIGEQYGQNAQSQFAGAGNIMAQLLAQYGKKPYSGTVNTYSGDPTTPGNYG